MNDSFVVEIGSTRLMWIIYFSLLLIFAPLIMNDNFNMNTNRYSDNELHLMSYQELRRLSILMQLPANIKKKYMISMIKAHQNGDGCTKLAISNKIMEERKVKRLSNKKKSSKSYKPGSPDSGQEVSANLSVSTKHEFETRFSYVAHYTAKGEINPGISQIIKQETEVSRRNRSILQQPRKPTRKLSTVGRTEIMLPRNHSLTTPVRLMPQSERGYPPPVDYETVPGLSNAKAHYQNVNSYNYHFHGEFSNSLMPTTTQESYKNEPYWHTREVYTNSLMPILTSLLTPNSVPVNSSGYGSQYNSSNTGKESSSFQGMYEKYIKSNAMIESQMFQTSDSAVPDNTHQLTNDNNNYIGRGSYVITKSDVDFEITSALNQINYQHYNRRDEVVTRNSNGNQNCLVDFYIPRNGEPLTPQMVHVTNVKDLSQYNGGHCRGDDKSLVPVYHRPFEASSIISYRTTEIVEANKNVHENLPPAIADYESLYREENWEELENENKIDKSRGNENFEGYFPSQPQESFLSEISDNSTDYSVEAESNYNLGSIECRVKPSSFQNFPRCRYLLGHNKYPEAFDDLNKSRTTLPSFLNTFSTSELHNKGYSVCKNSFTGTTETHLNPIMTCMHGSQMTPHTNSRYVNNLCGESQVQRQWLHNYPECQAPFSSETPAYSSWNEFSNEMDNEVVMQHSGHDVQVVKCRTHGCHYLYSISNSCN